MVAVEVVGKMWFLATLRAPLGVIPGPSIHAIRLAATQPKSEFIKSESFLVITVDCDCCPCPYVSIFLKRFTFGCTGFFHLIMIAQPSEKSGFSEDIAA